MYAVFEDAGQLYGRIGLNPMPLFQPRNPQAFGGLVAGASYGPVPSVAQSARIK